MVVVVVLMNYPFLNRSLYTIEKRDIQLINISYITLYVLIPLHLLS